MAQSTYKEPSELIANLPWTSHACHFYKSKKDLLDVLVPYFKAGLLNREFCIWVTSKDVGIKHALSTLKKALAELESFLETGQLEIHPYTDRYLADGGFSSEKVLTGWIDKCNQASANGYEGLRLSGIAYG